MSQQKAQFVPQLAMWQVMISKWIMMGSYKDTPPPTKTYHMGELWYKLCLITPPPITTHHIASCGTNYAFCDGTKLSHFFFFDSCDVNSLILRWHVAKATNHSLFSFFLAAFLTFLLKYVRLKTFYLSTHPILQHLIINFFLSGHIFWTPINLFKTFIFFYKYYLNIFYVTTFCF